MLYKYVTTPTPNVLDVIKDLMKIITGTTDANQLSTSSDAASCQLLDATHPSSWTQKAEPTSLNGVSTSYVNYWAVLESPLLADGTSRAYVPWGKNGNNLLVYHPADGWNATTSQLEDSTGAVFNHSFDANSRTIYINTNAVQEFYVYVKNTTVVVVKKDNYAPLFCAEFENIGSPKSANDLLPFVTGGVYAKAGTNQSILTFITPARTLRKGGSQNQRSWGNQEYVNNGYIAPPIGWEASTSTNFGGAAYTTYMSSTDTEAKVPFLPLWVFLGAWGVFGPIKDFPVFMLPHGFTASVGDTITGPDGTYMVFGCGFTQDRKTVMRVGS